MDQQISKFMKMMQILEQEWQKGEEDRVNREKELAEQQEKFEKASSQMGFLSSALSDISAQMEEMNADIEALMSSATKSIKKEEKWYPTFTSFENNFQDMRHQAFVNSAKHKKVYIYLLFILKN